MKKRPKQNTTKTSVLAKEASPEMPKSGRIRSKATEGQAGAAMPTSHAAIMPQPGHKCPADDPLKDNETRVC